MLDGFSGRPWLDFILYKRQAICSILVMIDTWMKIRFEFLYTFKSYNLPVFFYELQIHGIPQTSNMTFVHNINKQFLLKILKNTFNNFPILHIIFAVDL